MSFLKSRKNPENKIIKKEWLSGFFPIEIFDGIKRQQIFSIGTLIISILLISPIIIWLSHDPDSIRNPIIALAKFNAFMAISTLSINLVALLTALIPNHGALP